MRTESQSVFSVWYIYRTVKCSDSRTVFTESIHLGKFLVRPAGIRCRQVALVIPEITLALQLAVVLKKLAGQFGSYTKVLPGIVGKSKYSDNTSKETSEFVFDLWKNQAEFLADFTKSACKRTKSGNKRRNRRKIKTLPLRTSRAKVRAQCIMGPQSTGTVWGGDRGWRDGRMGRGVEGKWEGEGLGKAKDKARDGSPVQRTIE